jgi:hypothetical protein
VHLHELGARVEAHRRAIDAHVGAAADATRRQRVERARDLRVVLGVHLRSRPVGMSNAVVGSGCMCGLPIARLMEPGSGGFATVMEPPDRQGHGATREASGGAIATVMGPPDRHAHGATWT